MSLIMSAQKDFDLGIISVKCTKGLFINYVAQVRTMRASSPLL